MILEYMPQQLSREEIEFVIRKVIKEVGAQGSKDKGSVMPKLMPLLKGKADGRVANEMVTLFLESKY